MRVRIEWVAANSSGEVTADSLLERFDGHTDVPVRVVRDLPEWLAYALHVALRDRFEAGVDA